MTEQTKSSKKKVVALLSGGLDSQLAVKMMQKQGFEVHALALRTPFCDFDCGKGCGFDIVNRAEALNVPLKTVFLGEEYIEMLKNPKHGRGAGFNPCIDCRAMMFEAAKKINCDTLVTFEPENLFYMTGFWGEAIGILEKNGKTTIIAPELEVGRAKEESKNCDVITSERGTGLVSSLTKKIKGKKVCTDCQNHSTMLSLKKSVRGIKHSTEPFYNARIIKDSSEIVTLKKASKIIDEMFGICSNKIKKGQKESELQAILMSYAIGKEMFDTGYKSTLNPLIIAGGPNGALPHAQVTNRKFSNGGLIVVDLTLRYKGYVSDATRTFGLGKIF